MSKNKVRYTEDGFDLDMTYTSPRETRVLTLGFPATGLEHAYRNPRLEVSRYLEKHHDQHYNQHFAGKYGSKAAGGHGATEGDTHKKQQ